MKLLFDCPIAKAALAALRKAAPSLHADHLADWRGGAFRRADDAEVLSACHSERRVFVTFDQRTIPDLLRHWVAEERDHSGVVFGDENTVRPNSPVEVAAEARRSSSRAMTKTALQPSRDRRRDREGSFCPPEPPGKEWCPRQDLNLYVLSTRT